MARQWAGEDTRSRLSNWTKGQCASESLAAQILKSEGYDPDPSHPTGGRDGKKDMVFYKDGKLWIAAVYFPNGQKDLKAIRKKVKEDMDGVKKNNANGIAFVTNQVLSLSQRKTIVSLCNKKGSEIEIYHLERIRTILDNPLGYGIRLEFLEIQMEREEQLSFFKAIQQESHDLMKKMEPYSPPLVQSLTCHIRAKETSLRTICSINPFHSFVLCHPSNEIGICFKGTTGVELTNSADVSRLFYVQVISFSQ